jgi:parallel beta-helix repeat protein
MNTKYGILLVSIGLLLVFASVGTASGKIWYVDDDGDMNFTKIQDAIDAAYEGDTIFVYNGTYIEHLTIDKNNLTILGEDRNTTVIDGHGYEGDVVTIGYANCTINGFTIENSGTSDAGIKIVQLCAIPGRHNNISNNIIKNNYEGIYLTQSHNIITGNIILDNNDAGITASSNNIISHNVIFSNKGRGVSISSDNNTISDNNVSYNGYTNIALSGSKNNIISNNTIECNGGGIEITSSCYYNTIANNTISSTYEGGEVVVPSLGGIYISSSNHNKVITNIFIKNYGAIRLNQANYNLIRDNNILNNSKGISIYSSNNNLLYHNNLINNTEQASDDGSNSWDNGSIEGGNYWSDHNCTGNPSNGSEPYIIDADSIDHYPFEDLNGWIQLEDFSFDTGSPANPYPSIMGTHNGTIKPTVTITVSMLYTYPCVGTGGHTEQIIIYNESGIVAEANWTGYKGDWPNITFLEQFTLEEGETYNYSIRTGSYPQIHHIDELEVASGTGTITCDKFIDANGKVYYDWIPAIKLWAG